MTTTQSIDTRSRLAIALDTGDLAASVALAEAVAPHFGIAKVGLRLFSTAGPRAVEAIRATGLDVFLDVKLHDIPNTVGTAAAELGKLGARYLTIHAAGGVEMVKAAEDGLATGADSAGLPAPMVLAVTVLTSMGEAPAGLLAERVGIAQEGGAGGLVCAAPDLATVRPLAPGSTIFVPGIRQAGGETHDQQRVATPATAIGDGADVLVIGRAVSGSDDPSTKAAEIAAEVEAVER